MQSSRLAYAVSLLVLGALALSAPVQAAKSRTVVSSSSSSSTSVGNNVSIVITNGVSVVNTSSCTGVSGYLYQSIVIFFSGGSIKTTQSVYCP